MGGNKKEIEVDFSKCRFIKENMWFFTYDDFCENRKVIKKMFQEMDRDGKLFYMYYIYSNVNMGLKFKHAIWDYLNQYDPYGLELTRLRRSLYNKQNVI